MFPKRLIQGKNLLWLWLSAAILSSLSIAIIQSTGNRNFWLEMAVMSGVSCVCGVVLAWWRCKSIKQRFFGGLFFMGASLCLNLSVALLGCSTPSGHPYDHPYVHPTQTEVDKLSVHRQAESIRQEGRMKAKVARQIVPRDALADRTMLDLSSFYDGLLEAENSENIRSLTSGTHVGNGVKFDMRGKVELIRYGLTGVCGIPVEQKCSGIYFLHGVERGWVSNSTISQFVIHYSGDKQEVVPIGFGREVADEVLSENNKVLSVVPSNQLVWQEAIAANKPPQPLRAFFITHWDNPFPERTIASIDFKPGIEFDNAFLVAITIQPANNKDK